MNSLQQRKLPIARLAQPETVAVHRASQACQHCRVHKLKCDKRLPTCTTCLQYSTSCRYVLTEGKRRRLQMRQGNKTQRSRKTPAQPLLAVAGQPGMSSSPISSSSDAQAPKSGSVGYLTDSLTLDGSEGSVEQFTTSVPETYGQDTTTMNVATTATTTAASFFSTLLEVESLYQNNEASGAPFNIPEFPASVVPEVLALPSMSPDNTILESMAPPGNSLSGPFNLIPSVSTQPSSYTEGLDRLSQALRDNLTLSHWNASDRRHTTMDVWDHRTTNSLLVEDSWDDMLKDTTVDLEPIISRMSDPQRRAKFTLWFENAIGANLPKCLLYMKSDKKLQLRNQLIDRLRHQPYVLTPEDYENGAHFLIIPESLPSLRCLVLPTDLLFHSHVVHSLLYLTSHVVFQQWGNAHYQRIMNRVAQGQLSPMTFLPLAVVFGPLASHAALKNLMPSAVGRRYFQSFVALMPSAMSDDSPNTIHDLLIAANCAFSQNYPIIASNLISLAIRMCYQHRLHLLDHPQFAQVVRRDMPWLSNQSTTPYQYPAESLDPILKQNFRNVFWMTFFMDSFSSLVSEQLPRIHSEEISIREPLSKRCMMELACPIMTDPLSSYNTDQGYPTIPTLTWEHNPVFRIDFSLGRHIHHLSRVRPLYTNDRSRWEAEWHRVESQLDQWHREYTAKGFPKNTVTLSPEATIHQLKVANSRYLNYVVYYMLVIYLHYHGPLLTWPFSTFEPGDMPDVDLTDIELLLTHEERSWERCWEATVAVEKLMKHIFPFVIYFQNSFVMPAFYTVAVVCCHTLATTRMDDPDLQKQERWHLADQFIDDVVEYFTRYSQYYPINHRMSILVHKLKMRALSSNPVPVM